MGYWERQLRRSSISSSSREQFALSHRCQCDSRKTYAVLVCALFGLFKMHLLVKSYKYQIQLLSNLLYEVKGFCINGL